MQNSVGQVQVISQLVLPTSSNLYNTDFDYKGQLRLSFCFIVVRPATICFLILLLNKIKWKPYG